MKSIAEHHVLIIGGGITGLLIAHGLQRAGVPFTVFEADVEVSVRRREWSMGVHWSVPLLEQLLPEPLMTKIIEATVDPSLDYSKPPASGSRIYDGLSGDLLKELATDGTLLRLSRSKMRALCSEGIEVKFCHKLVNIVRDDSSDSVVAHFVNGAHYTGTVLIGCDGPRSTVRSLLLDPEASKARPMEGIVNLSTTFSYGNAEKARFVRSAHPVFSMMIHPDIFTYLSLQHAPNPGKAEDWQYFLMAAWMGERDESLNNTGRLQLLKDKSKGLAEPFRSAVQWIPKDMQISYTDISYWIAEPWDTCGGRVTMAGDAAHPMPPYRGQGLNHAIQDAYNFVQCMVKLRSADGLQPELLQAYSDEVVKRGASETAMSKQNGYMLLSYTDFKDSPYMKHGFSRQQK